MKDFQEKVERAREAYMREIERRAELWHEQRRQLEMIHDADRQNLQRELEADDRRVKNRILDFLSPARRRERHETPQRALSTSHEKAMNAYLERVKSEREPLDRQYEAQERRLYEQHGQDLAKQERSRIEKAEELARKHELQNKQEKAPAPERSHDLGGRNR